MSRLKIDISGKLLSSVSLAVRITDINYGNHTGNDAMIGLIHEARMTWLQQYNYTELNIEGVGLIMGDIAIEFKKESFYGDILEIKLYAGEITKSSFDLFYTISTTRHNNPILVAKVKSGMVCYNYNEKKIALIPVQLLQILKGI